MSENHEHHDTVKERTQDTHTAHVDHTGHEQMFKHKFWVSLVLSIPVLMFSQGLQILLGFNMPTFPGSNWISPLFSLVVFLYSGLPFLQMARPEIKNHQPGMMTLISLAITVAFVYSVAAVFLFSGEDFFWELVTLIDIMLLGHWIKMRSVRQASGALDALAKLMPDTAERVASDGSTQTVSSNKLHTGDLLLVRPGASIPADGEVIEGQSQVNESMITGESKPVEKGVSAKVIGGSINGGGSLRVKVSATGEDSALAGIMHLVKQAQESKSNTQMLADKAAGWLFYVALGSAIVTAIAWTIAVGFNIQVIERVATVLVIACPHALGLAIPLVVAITTAMGANNGILIRDQLAMEKARNIDIVIFDKTGTLTEGRVGVVALRSVEGMDESEANQKGQSIVHLIKDDKPVASLALADVTRPESQQAVSHLHKMGVKVAMLTGDSRFVAEVVAKELDIDTFFAEVLPENKDQKVIELQQQGNQVAMVGDGINDAPALTRADVGIAIGSGTDVAVESAGIILVKSNPLEVVKIIQLSRASYDKMRQNLI